MITNIVNGRIYVGSAVNFHGRRRIHQHHLRENKHHSIALQRAYNKYGNDKFRFDIIEEVVQNDVILQKEQFWIDKLKPDYNCSPTAGSNLGKKASPKTLERISNASKRNGQKPEFREKQMLKDYSWTKTEEFRNKVKNSRPPWAWKRSEDAKKKISLARGKGKLHIGRKRPILVTDTFNNINYLILGIKQCAELFDLKIARVQREVTGKGKYINNRYKFSYYGEH